MPYRVLVVANELLEGAPDCLPEDVRPLYERATEVRFVVPVHTGRLEWLVSDSDRKRAQAAERLRTILGDMGRMAHHPAHGEVGDENQLVAIEDALAHFDADAIVVVGHPPGQQNWHERGVVEGARNRFGRPVHQVRVTPDGRVARASSG